jgi:hypothetical protein
MQNPSRPQFWPSSSSNLFALRLIRSKSRWWLPCAVAGESFRTDRVAAIGHGALRRLLRCPVPERALLGKTKLTGGNCSALLRGEDGRWTRLGQTLKAPPGSGAAQETSPSSRSRRTTTNTVHRRNFSLLRSSADRATVRLLDLHSGCSRIAGQVPSGGEVLALANAHGLPLRARHAASVGRARRGAGLCPNTRPSSRPQPG